LSPKQSLGREQVAFSTSAIAYRNRFPVAGYSGMIGNEKPPAEEIIMFAAEVRMLAENTRTMTFAEGRAFIERTRRQLDRFDALPHPPGEAIAPEDAAAIRRQCDELEADINRSLSNT
jgi:hypothetical protein